MRLLPPSSSCADEASSATAGASGALDSKSMTSAFTPKDLCFVTRKTKTTEKHKGTVQNKNIPWSLPVAKRTRQGVKMADQRHKQSKKSDWFPCDEGRESGNVAKRAMLFKDSQVENTQLQRVRACFTVAMTLRRKICDVLRCTSVRRLGRVQKEAASMNEHGLEGYFERMTGCSGIDRGA